MNMNVFRVEKNKNYTVMSNTHLKDRSLSLKAKGLLSLILSLPDDWDFSISGITAICTESTTAITSALKELEVAGYFAKRMVQTTGRITWEYVIYEQPHQYTGNQPVDDQPVENVPQLSTNKSNTNKSIKDKNIGQRQGVPSNLSSSKLFSSQKDQTKNKKAESYRSQYIRMLGQFDFNEEVLELIHEFIEALLESNTFLPSVSFTRQLDLLASAKPTIQKQALQQTITRGWKSVDYALSSLTNTGAPSFDTARNSENQFKDPKNDRRHEKYKDQEKF